jgi:integrase
MESRVRELALFNLGIDSKLRGCDLVSLKVRDDYGTHSMRRTKATLIYRRTKNLRAVQLLLGHSKLESTVRYLGIEVDDALEISEQTEI